MDKSLIEDKFNGINEQLREKNAEISKLKKADSDRTAAENQLRTERDQLQTKIGDGLHLVSFEIH